MWKLDLAIKAEKISGGFPLICRIVVIMREIRGEYPLISMKTNEFYDVFDQ